LISLFGCASTGRVSGSKRIEGKQGIYHKVEKGETLWRIAQAYQIGMDELIGSNEIKDAARIEKDQLIFIPGAVEVKEIVFHQDDPDEEEFAWPIKGKVVGYYGKPQGKMITKGILIEPREEMLVAASRKGKVVFADYLAGYRYTVILDHRDGYYTVYSQNDKVLVDLDDLVFKGDPIAELGRAGGINRLYFEIRRNGLADNPLYYLPKL